MKIHIIGIGGIGVSSIAQYYLSENHFITGSNVDPNETTDYLIKKGIEITIESDKNNIKEDLDLIVFSPAIPDTDPELKKGKELGIKCLSYPQALGEISKNYFTIAVSGTHGKSTTSSMAALSLIKAGLDPTVVIGTKLKEFGNTNFRKGNSKYLIIEADEYKQSFLNYHPNVIILTGIEKEHLDCYDSLDHIKKTYLKYISQMDKDGTLIIHRDLFNFSKKIINKTKNIIFYDKVDIDLRVPGDHNRSNASSVIELGKLLNIKEEDVISSLQEFNGSWRRFEEHNLDNFTLISDYGHHPTEVLVTLRGAREKYSDRRIFLVFQPHQKQRTYLLFKEFVKVFETIEKKKLADEIIITDIYDVAGREGKYDITSLELVDHLEKSNYVPKEELEECIKEDIKENDILIIMGAGDIYDTTQNLLTFYQKNN